MLLHGVGADYRPELVEGALHVVLLNLLDAGVRQQRLCQPLRRDLVVEVAKVARVLDRRNKRSLKLLLKELFGVDICEPRVKQDFVHVVGLAEAASPVFVEHLGDEVFGVLGDFDAVLLAIGPADGRMLN